MRATRGGSATICVYINETRVELRANLLARKCNKVSLLRLKITHKDGRAGRTFFFLSHRVETARVTRERIICDGLISEWI